MHRLLVEVLALVVGVAFVAGVARRLAVSRPILLVLAGLAVSFIPGVPHSRLDPELVLVLVLPPLLYTAALNASLTAFRANVRPIGLLSIGLVLFTTLVVGWLAHVLVPGLPLAAALAFGAIVSPPDAVAATAIGRRLGLPPRVLTVLQGESLLNDATALVAYRVSVAAVVSGSLSLLEVGGRFLLASAGGLLVGLLVAKVVEVLRRRIDDPLIENTLSLLTPFLAFLPTEGIGASGVLAVVVTGLYLGHRAPMLLPAASRLQTGSRWVHLRECLPCGHIGCCDSSPNRHATAHFQASDHPVMQSFEPGEDWRWCYVDAAMV